VDSGSPFKQGREISSTGTKDLPLGMDSITGYTIISAESLDDAVELVKDCPMIKSLRVYEAIEVITVKSLAVELVDLVELEPRLGLERGERLDRLCRQSAAVHQEEHPSRCRLTSSAGRSR
jgi:hypothetical protein